MISPIVRIVTVIAILSFCSALAAGDTKSWQTPQSDQIIDMLPGVVEPAEQVTLSAPFDGVLMQIAVQEGDLVRAGQPIAIMDNRVAQAAVKIAEQVAGSDTEIRIAKSQYDAAQQFAKRVAKAFQHRAASELELERAEAAVEQAQGSLKRAREEKKSALARLDLEQARLAEHTVAAPFDGQVIRTIARQGESLNRAQAISSIANVKRLAVEMQVPLFLFRQLKPGQTYSLYGSAPVDDFINAQLVMIEPHIDPATRTFRCRFEIQNQEESLPAGFTVRLVTPTPNRAAVSGSRPKHDHKTGET